MGELQCYGGWRYKGKYSKQHDVAVTINGGDGCDWRCK